MKEGRERPASGAAHEVVQMINFLVGKDEYAVHIQTVREVISLREITQLPKAPSFVKGVINLRGEVIPIIDLREKFGLEHAPYDEQTNIIIVESEERVIGVVVDRVSHVIRIPSDDLSPAPPLIGGLSSRYVNGVAKLGERLVVILNMGKVLTAEELITLDRLQQPAGAAVHGEER